MMLLLLLVTSCAAIHQDLIYKMFTFPQETNTAHVKLTTSRQELSALTVCFRSFTDLKRQHSLFSLATPTDQNAFLILKSPNDRIHIWANGKEAILEKEDYKLNTWHSICSTWDSASGLIQLWLDGKPSSRKFTSSGSSISGPMIIVLGQKQDSLRGFEIKQSFVGMMSDLHLWDYTLTPCKIQHYVNNVTFTEGNVLNWNTLDFQIIGQVVIENRIKACL